MRIAIYDDHSRVRDEWVARLRALALDVVSVATDEVAAWLASAHDALHRLRSGEQATAGTQFDGFDVVVVDYDLFDAEDGVLAATTGESLAYYLTLFSQASYVIALNGRTPRGFDVRLLREFSSFADFSVRSELLHHPRLWSREWPEGFCPWGWPSVGDELARVAERRRLCMEGLDAPVAEVLGMARVWGAIPTAFRDLIAGASREEDGEVSVRDFIRGSGSVLKGADADAAFDDTTLARLAARRLARWVNGLMLPLQSVWVDGPHLVTRFPSLAAAVELTGHTGDLADRALEDSETGRRHSVGQPWADRPVWDWESVKSDLSILEVAEPWSRDDPGLCFCEDSSRFRLRADCMTVNTGIPGAFAIRHIEALSSRFDDHPVAYVPVSRVVR